MPRKSKIRIGDGSEREIQVRRLSRQIRQHNRDYTAGRPKIPDWKYDAKVQRLRELDPTDPVLLEVGAPPDDAPPGKKKKLPLKMGSLNKCRPAETLAWLKKVLKSSTAVIVTPKLDGIAGLLHYRNGRLIGAYKRGDGYIGVDVMQLARHVTGVVQHSVDLFGRKRDKAFCVEGDFFVKGEFIIHTSLFQEKYRGKVLFKGQEPYANARNFVAGLFNRIKVDDTMKQVLTDICFIAYDYELTTGSQADGLNNRDKLEKLRFLEQCEFITVICPAYPRSQKKHDEIARLYKERYNTTDTKRRTQIDARIETLYTRDKHENTRIASVVFNDHQTLTEESLINLLISNKQDLDLLQDGLVLDILDRKVCAKLGFEANGLNPAFARSIKLDRKDQDAQIGVCKAVEYRYTKRGLFKPRLVLETPLDFNGVEVTYATAHNWKFVLDNQLGPKAKVVIIRSGDVIPFILEVDTPSYAQRPMTCPFCGCRLARTDHDLYCYNESCTGRIYAQLHGFFDIVEVDGLSEGTLDKLFEAGYDTIPKVLSITSKQLLELDGFADKKAEAIPREIKKALTNVSLARLMHASSCFVSETFALGETRLSAVVNHLGADVVLLDDTARRLTVGQLETIDGVAYTTARLFVDGLPKFLRFFRRIKDLVTLRDFNTDGKLKGRHFVFTGFRDKNLSRTIEDHGGHIAGSVAVSRALSTVLFHRGESKKTEVARNLKVTLVPADKAEAWVRKHIS